MRRGTTESKSIALSGDVDFTKVKRAVVTIKQGDCKIDKDITLDSDGTGVATFTPDQTVKLHVGACLIQVKLSMEDGTVMATNIMSDVIDGDILNEDEI